MHRVVLKLRERVLGAEHPDTLASRNDLAAVLASRVRVLGAEHPDVALSSYNLAVCLKAQKKLTEALASMQRAEQVWMKILGPDHPNTKLAKAARERHEAEMKAGQ